VDLNIGINERNFVQFKIPYSFTYGSLSNTKGISDISLSFTRNLIENERQQLNLTIGSKIPVGDGNRHKWMDRSLPMYYQQSLGTLDFVAGISWITRRWLVATGIQHPFGNNNNQFRWDVWEGTERLEDALMYPQSVNLDRGTDIMFRVERNFRFSKFNINLGLLPIYRLNLDKITSPQSGEVVESLGSDGLALTLLTGLTYNFNVKTGFKIMNGFRLRRRPKNPDGLSREFVSNIGFLIKF